MAIVIPLAEPTLLVGAPIQSFLPSYLSDLAIPGRCFVIPENEISYAANNKAIASGILKIREYGGFQVGDLIFIDRSAEVGVLNKERLELLEATCRSEGIPVDRVVYASQNPKIAPDFSSNKPRWLFFHHYLISMANAHKNTFDDFSSGSTADKILLLNNKIRPHRVAMLAALQKEGLLDRFLFSWSGKNWLFDMDAAMHRASLDFPSYSEELKNFDKPEMRGFRADASKGPVEGLTIEQLPMCFMELVAESDYESWSSRITEKTIKAIAAHRPFVLMASPGSLDLIHGLGFETFGNVFDESYDHIENADARLRAIVEVLKDALKKPAEIAASTYAICAANQRHLRQGLIPLLKARLAADIAAIA